MIVNRIDMIIIMINFSLEEVAELAIALDDEVLENQEKPRI